MRSGLDMGMPHFFANGAAIPCVGMARKADLALSRPRASWHREACRRRGMEGGVIWVSIILGLMTLAGLALGVAVMMRRGRSK